MKKKNSKWKKIVKTILKKNIAIQFKKYFGKKIRLLESCKFKIKKYDNLAKKIKNLESCTDMCVCVYIHTYMGLYIKVFSKKKKKIMLSISTILPNF